jgi:hypothetical protein
MPIRNLKRSPHRSARPTLEALESRELLAASIRVLSSSLPPFFNALKAPTGINDRGQIIGTSGSQGFIWSASSGFIALKPGQAGGTAVPMAINDSGEVVGYTSVSRSRNVPTVWDAQTHRPTLLAEVSPGNSTGEALAINAAGGIVGYEGVMGADGWTTDYGVLWSDPSYAPETLDATDGISARADGITNQGLVVTDTSAVTNGQLSLWPYIAPIDPPGAFDQVVPFQRDGVFVDAIMSPGGVNGGAVMVGEATDGTKQEAVLWTQIPNGSGFGPQALGNFAVAGVNDNKVVIGSDQGKIRTGPYGIPYFTPVLWSPATGEVPLAKFLPANSGWLLTSVAGINDQNQIVGGGWFQGKLATYVMTLPSFQPTDLAVTLNDNHVTPAGARDLHLHQFFGGERVNVPVTVQNLGPALAQGHVQIQVYLSPTPALAGGARLLQTQTVVINLVTSAQASTTVPVTIPRNLPVGQSEYVVVRIRSGDILETDAQPGPDTNDIAAGTTAYEFVGSASASAHFAAGTYFQFVRNALTGTPALPGVNIADPQSFVAASEGDSLWPYKNALGVPMIGVGINLRTVSGQTRADLIAAVRAYYVANVDPGFQKTDDQIIAMLIAQALPVDVQNPSHRAPQAVTFTDDQKLFNDLYSVRAAVAQQAIGSAWSSLSTAAQIALVDEIYRRGSIPTGVAAALDASGGPDYARAGFALAASGRVPPAGSVRLRIEAEYQNLLAGHVGDLGELV